MQTSERTKQARWIKENLTESQRNRLLYEDKICSNCKKYRLLRTFAIPYTTDEFYDTCRICRNKAVEPSDIVHY